MSTVDPYTTHDREADGPDATARVDPSSPYAYPSPYSGEQAGEPLDLHPYEQERDASGDTMLDLTEPVATLRSEPRYDRPEVPGPDASTWPPRTPFPDEDPDERSHQRDKSRSFVSSTRGLGEEVARLAQRIESPETKVFYKTSEFALTVIASVILMVAAAASSTFDADQLWPLFTWLIGFYLLSRGLAKAGTRHR